jgi:catechol 2,3-dioxygenase-like lactoylglutathione lyase family enzyme
MKRLSLLLAFILCCSTALAQDTPTRPKILGISSVGIQVTDYCKGIDFYSRVLGSTLSNAVECPPPGQTVTHYGMGLRLRGNQQINLGSFGTPDPSKLVIDFGFFTDDLQGMLKYFKAQGIEVMPGGKYGLSIISIKDPEGHRIAFFEEPRNQNRSIKSGAPQRIIHVGFVVENRENMDHFYKDILGFRPYWHGGMKDDKDDWVAMQVPDGTDWVEYMLNIPLDADKKLLGVMNHIALGVTDIQAAKAQLLKNGATLTEEPKLGRDGKWQLNLYDPDFTRIEFMEFTPKEKPCCSEFAGPHPKP